MLCILANYFVTFLHRYIVTLYCAVVPAYWTTKDRLNFIRFGEKRKTEYCQNYACIAMGLQLYAEMMRLRHKTD